MNQITKLPRELRVPQKSQAGRNNQGRITIRWRGGGHKRFARVIDKKRLENDNLVGKATDILYDPNRNCRLLLVQYENGKRTLILAPQGVNQENLTEWKIRSGKDENIPIQLGNSLPLRNIPVKTPIHNLELIPGKGGQLIRSAGTWAEIVGKEVWRKGQEYCQVKLRSKETRLILADCRATVGRVGNQGANRIKLRKAGQNRWRGNRPEVRGSAMNPVDHPHGGGEGKAPRGKDPRSPWGWKTLGVKTRRKSKPNWYIVNSRHSVK
ncbi:MAG: 50S ribosomal protein L2 [Candidatus Moeniiplasma glomeromycotorum]|nr:50S ribosomal protein L2 [Candidatus Moeniiplasma glomeromycotorum]MCE8168345.1 50S ribosomal protein L2 [Candidatus Moeniiplasma glomeromycotorum]MCE8169916.1 50S ribosomal protein L2 [Candidatus Moeniiplasma glomeromycotorum]